MLLLNSAAVSVTLRTVAQEKFFPSGSRARPVRKGVHFSRRIVWSAPRWVGTIIRILSQHRD